MTKTSTLHGFIAITLLAILALAPLQFASANTDDSNGGFFSNLRERQVASRQNVKANLLQMLSSEEASEEEAFESVTQSTNLATITYQLTDIADRIESRMLILENQNTTLSLEAYTKLESARTKLGNVTSILTTGNITDAAVITNELASVRTDLQKIIGEIKTTLLK